MELYHSNGFSELYLTLSNFVRHGTELDWPGGSDPLAHNQSGTDLPPLPPPPTDLAALRPTAARTAFISTFTGLNLQVRKNISYAMILVYNIPLILGVMTIAPKKVEN